MDEARHVVIELNKKFTGNNAKIRASDYALLEDIIDRGTAVAEETDIKKIPI